MASACALPWQAQQAAKRQTPIRCGSSGVLIPIFIAHSALLKTCTVQCRCSAVVSHCMQVLDYRRAQTRRRCSAPPGRAYNTHAAAGRNHLCRIICMQVLGLSPGADSEAVQRSYRRAKNDARGNKERLEKIEAAHTSIMMSGLSARMKVGWRKFAGKSCWQSAQFARGRRD